uniref:Uncharacterized protein n=1 Tax=Globodera rostochiensis TaxID=31243 RepID=A0A914HPA5_GLORO
MEEFWILILVLFFGTNSLDKAESVQLEETPHKIIDEIFGEGWWDNEKDEEWNKLTLEQNALHQIDLQNTQIGQIEHNSTYHSGQIEPNSTDQLRQMTTDKNIDENAQKHKTVGKELSLNYRTIYKWKSELGQTIPNHMYGHSEQKELMKCYYELKDQNPKISDGDIAKMLKIGKNTLFRWKSQFKRHQLHPNSVEENVTANVQEIENSNRGSFK